VEAGFAITRKSNLYIDLQRILKQQFFPGFCSSVASNHY